MPVLTVVDVCSIQGFVFSSNRLTDIIAASQMVEWAVSVEQDGALADSRADEVLFSGGGNALLKFKTIESARNFAARYSRKIYDNSAAMKIAVVHREYQDGQLTLAIKAIFSDLAISKTQPVLNYSLPGLGVTMTCPYTGLPAKRFDKLRSEAVAADPHKNRKSAKSSLDLNSILDGKSGRYAFTSEFDLLGRSRHDSSYLGIVHIDGNSVGEKIKQWLDKQEGRADNEIIIAYKEWSNELSELARNSFKSACQLIIDKIDALDGDICVVGKNPSLNFALNKENDKILLPLRPIIIGGDDITFVCEGRLALRLAEEVLRQFSVSQIKHLGKISACAGVAFIKTHSPFARGYELAEGLCSSAKAKARSNKALPCAIDWHIGNIRPYQTVEEIRKTQYRKVSGTNEQLLTLRPYIVDFAEPSRQGQWLWLSNTVLGCIDGDGLRGKKWGERKNKVKAMVSELNCSTPQQFKSFCDGLKVTEPDLAFPEGIDNLGRTGNGTAIIDAVEIMDMHQTF